MSRPSDRLPRVPDQVLQSADGVPPAFDIQVSYRFGVPLIYVSGELDVETVDRLREAIAEELSLEPRALLLECSRLIFVDSRGLSLLFDTLGRLKADAWLGMVGANPNLRRLAEMTGLADRAGFRFLDNLQAVPAVLAATACDRTAGGGE